MPGEIAYKLTADEAQALQAVARLSREFGLNETAIKKAVEAAKDLDRTQQQMGREAQRIFEETRTEAERYQQELARLKELHEKNAISADTYDRAVKQVKASHASAFGQQALAEMQSFAQSFLPVTSAADALLQTLTKINEAKQRGAEADRTAEMAEGSLAEVAGGDAQQYKKLLAKSRSIAANSGMSRQQAAALTFAAASAGAVDQMDVFAELHGQGIVQDPENLMRATQTLQTSLGRSQTGSLRDITSKLLAAGEHSPQKIAQLGPAAALAGVNAQDAGVSADELLAAVAVESKATGEAGIAGTMQKSLQKALSRLRSGKDEQGQIISTDEEGHLLDENAKKVRAAVQATLHGKQGLMSQLHAIQRLGLSDAALQKLFGRQEGLMGYKLLLRNEAEFNEAKTSIGGAAAKDLVGRVLTLPQNDARAAGAKLVRQAESEQAEAESAAYGSATNAADAVIKNWTTQQIKQGSHWTAGFNRFADAATGWIPGVRGEQAREILRSGESGLGGGNLVSAVNALGGENAVFGKQKLSDGGEKTRQAFERAAEKLSQAADALKNSAQRPRPTLLAPDKDR
jgi:hypothetical protein